MSCNREHVIWQSKNRSWNIGFFQFVNVNTHDPDWDYEWDVEYLYDEFFWVSTGHSSPETAFAAWRGANPGYVDSALAYQDNAGNCDHYDSMAQEAKRK